MWLSLLTAMLAYGAAGSAEPPAPPAYTDVNSVQAERVLRKSAERDPSQVPKAEHAEWARARLAWIALLRLQGKEAEARRVFGGCEKYCEKWGPAKEWEAVRRWGCGGKPADRPAFCGK